MSGYCWYKTQVTVTAAQAKAGAQLELTALAATGLIPNTDPMGPWMGWMKGSLNAEVTPGCAEHYDHVPAQWLRSEGEQNTITLFEESGGNPTKVKLVRRITT